MHQISKGDRFLHLKMLRCNDILKKYNHLILLQCKNVIIIFILFFYRPKLGSLEAAQDRNGPPMPSGEYFFALMPCAHVRTQLNLDQNLIQVHTTVQSWTEFKGCSVLNRVGAMQIMTELRSSSNLNSVQAWSALVQWGLSGQYCSCNRNRNYSGSQKSTAVVGIKLICCHLVNAVE